MSSIPPNMPPGGGAPPPYPPYDPKTQWQVHREQQRAAWRAQREAWKAQRHAWKAGYVGAYGPRVPSVVGPVLLVGIGVIALLVVTGRIAGGEFWAWYAHWWPLLLIAAGLGLLAEWAIDLRRETPVRRGGGFVGILILLAILGFGASGWNHVWGPMGAEFGDRNGDFFNTFGEPEHDFDQEVLNVQIPANASVEIQNARGDVSVTAGDTSSVQVQAHEVAYASSDAEAGKIFADEKPHVTVSGNAVLVKSDSHNNGHINLTITVPKSAKVTVNAGRGDVTAAGLGAGIDVGAARGDVRLSAITGATLVHFGGGKHDLSAHQVDGDLTIEGNCNDITLSEIKGRITHNGEIFGEAHFENVAAPVSLHTTITNVQVAELPGDLMLNSDDLRITDAKGPVHVSSRSKDIDLSQIYGDSNVEDRNGRIAIEPAGSYNVEANNAKGDVEVTLPPNTSATVDGHTRNGEIITDFGLSVSGEQTKTVSGRIGAGGSRIILTADNGDVHIKRGSSQPPEQPASGQATPKISTPSNAPHLKTPKSLPAPPVSQ